MLVALMDVLGIDTAFGVVSVHNLSLVDAIAQDSALSQSGTKPRQSTPLTPMGAHAEE